MGVSSTQQKRHRRLHTKVCALIHFNAFECAHSFECAYSYLIIPLWLFVHVLLHQSYQIVCRLYTHWLEEVDCYVYAYQVIKYIPHSTYRYCTTTDVPQISYIVMVYFPFPCIIHKYIVESMASPIFIAIGWLLRAWSPHFHCTDRATGVPQSANIEHIM